MYESGVICESNKAKKNINTYDMNHALSTNAY